MRFAADAALFASAPDSKWKMLLHFLNEHGEGMESFLYMNTADELATIHREEYRKCLLTAGLGG